MTEDTMTDEEIDEAIDELAAEIQQSIEKAKETNERYDGVFDPKYRRMEEAKNANNMSAILS